MKHLSLVRSFDVFVVLGSPLDRHSVISSLRSMNNPGRLAAIGSAQRRRVHQAALIPELIEAAIETEWR